MEKWSFSVGDTFFLFLFLFFFSFFFFLFFFLGEDDRQLQLQCTSGRQCFPAKWEKYEGAGNDVTSLLARV